MTYVIESNSNMYMRICIIVNYHIFVPIHSFFLKRLKLHSLFKTEKKS